MGGRSGRSDVMKLNELSTRLQAEHHHDQQACLTISAAVAEVEHGLGFLARLGHVYHLEPGPAYDLPEWPRLLFHVTSAPNGRVVRSWWEARDLGPGWWPTYAEAQYKEGVRAQFAGRGGIGDRSLPMLVDGGPVGPRPNYPSEPKANQDIIEQWKREVAGVRDRGEGSWGEVTIHDGGSEEPHRADDRGSTAPEAGPGVSAEHGLGNTRDGLDGGEDCLSDLGPAEASRIPQDAVQGEQLPDRQQSNGGAEAELRRVLSSSAKTLAATRGAREAAGPCDKHEDTAA